MSRWKGISLRFPRFDASWIGAIALIALAIGIRVWLIAMKWPWPLLDSDEGTMGLMGIHILKGETPIFFYHQYYMGAAEAYLGALMFRIWGVSVFSLRMGMILLFTLFLIFMYLLTSLLFSKKWALFTLFLLALGSDAILTRELAAVGGDAETLVSGTLILLLSTWLSLSVQDGSQRKRRVLAYAGWGLAAGFGVWSHLLVAPFILMGALILLLFCHREIFNREILKCFSWPAITLLVSFITGALPLIIFNAQPQNFAHNIFITFWNNLHVPNIPVPGVTQKPFYALLPYQLRDAFQISLPTATDASPLCPVTTRPDGIAILQANAVNFSSPYAAQCTLTHTVWPLGVVTLWIIATLLALYLLRPYWRRFIPSQWSPEEKPLVVRQVGRLSLLAIAGITFILFALSPNAALSPVASSRYLIGLLVAIPALLWPLWSGINAVKPLALQVAHVTAAVRLARFSVFLRRGILLLIGISLLLGTINTFTGIFPSPPLTANEDIFDTQIISQHPNVPDTNAFEQKEHGLITRLHALQIRYIYSDYWTCDRLMFQTREKLVCSAVQATDKSGRVDTKETFCAGVLADNTRGKANNLTAQKISAQNRYDLYVKQVARAANSAAYVLHANSTLATLMAQCASTSPIIYTQSGASGYVIYQPTTKLRVVHR